MTGKCRHQALYTAYVAIERYPVRIAYGHINNNPHVQTQAYVDGQWYWLVKSNDSVKFTEISNFTPTHYFEFADYVDWVKIWANQ